MRTYISGTACIALLFVVFVFLGCSTESTMPVEQQVQGDLGSSVSLSTEEAELVASGSGWILMPADNPHHHSFSFTLSFTEGEGFNARLQYVDHHPAGQEGGGFTLHMNGPALACNESDGRIRIRGQAVRKPMMQSRGGTKERIVEIRVRFIDNGEPGSVPVGPDRFSLEIQNEDGTWGYTSGPEMINGGNIQAANLGLVRKVCPPPPSPR